MQTISSLEKQIADHPFIVGMKPRFCEFLSKCATLGRFGSGQQIFREGGDADHLYLILQGEVTLETFVPGLGMATIQTVGPGEALGWSWLVAPYEWQFSASTSKPTEVISFEAAPLRKKTETDPEFRDELLTRVDRMLVHRLKGTRMQLVDVYGMRP